MTAGVQDAAEMLKGMGASSQFTQLIFETFGNLYPKLIKSSGWLSLDIPLKRDTEVELRFIDEPSDTEEVRYFENMEQCEHYIRIMALPQSLITYKGFEPKY